MPTTKPRIAVTLNPHRAELLRRLAKLQGCSASSILADLLETVAPVLERVAVTLENVSRTGEEVRSNLLRSMEEAEAALAPVLGRLSAQGDLFLDGVNASLSELRRRMGGGADPQPIIMGVRSGSPPGSVPVSPPRPGSGSRLRGARRRSRRSR